jgi:hypothetical protein
VDAEVMGMLSAPQIIEPAAGGFFIIQFVRAVKFEKPVKHEATKNIRSEFNMAYI